MLIPGDGTGPELTDATRRVLEATGVAFDWDVREAGADVMERNGGNPLPPDVLDAMHAIFQEPRYRASPWLRRRAQLGLSPEAAGALAYLAGPFSGALLLIIERTSRSVRFHAWQAFIGLGTLGLASLACLGLAFFFLLFSPRGFAVMRWARS